MGFGVLVSKLWGLVPVQYRGIAIGVLIAVLVVSLWGFGEWQYRAGKKVCNGDHAVGALIVANKEKKNLERVINETAKMSDDDIDADLLNLGILRDAADR